MVSCLYEATSHNQLEYRLSNSSPSFTARDSLSTNQSPSNRTRDQLSTDQSLSNRTLDQLSTMSHQKAENTETKVQGSWVGDVGALYESQKNLVY